VRSPAKRLRFFCFSHDDARHLTSLKVGCRTVRARDVTKAKSRIGHRCVPKADRGTHGKLPEPPSIDANKRLRIAGIFPGDPVQINFDLQFEAVGGQWRLFGIAVNPAKSASAAPAPAESKPADNKKTTPPAKQGK
jgi:hypothetical protein